MLIVSDVVAYTGFVISIIVFGILFSENSVLYLGLWWNGSTVLMSVGLCFALHKIRLYSSDFASSNL